MNDTIIAQATAIGQGSISVLRISGVKTRDVAVAVLGKLPKPRYADYLEFRGINGVLLDKGIAIWYPGPNSFTGEDMLELQCHGNPIILDLLSKYILTLTDIRIANPGEFSERAFLNNKLDLAQAEAISDLITASSEQAVYSALRSLQGDFSVQINHLVKKLISLRSFIEVSIEVPEEEVIFLSKSKIRDQINEIIICLNNVCEKARYGSLLREGIKVVIAGRPNAGKSSLLNKLAGREAAIVTDIAGTTRDVLHEYIHIDGIPLHIVDTAGLHDTNNKIERIGIEMAWKEIEHADHLLLIVDGTITTALNPAEILPDFIARLPGNLPITVIRNKIDISGEDSKIGNIDGYSFICLSAHTGEGMNSLRNHLKQVMGFGSRMEGNFLARRRHLQALEKTAIHLNRGKEQIENNLVNIEFLAEELRLAQESLNQITGEFTSDNLLDSIFSNFCIGK